MFIETLICSIFTNNFEIAKELRVCIINDCLIVLYFLLQPLYYLERYIVVYEIHVQETRLKKEKVELQHAWIG